MNTKLKNLLLKAWPVIVILALVLVIFKQNYTANTQLIGWDNLVPEFNFPANIQRSVFAVWQEYQGLGLLGGMGHASEIVHQLTLLLMSFVVSSQLLRYSWTFLMLFTGSVGTFFLIKEIILKDSGVSSLKNQFVSLIGAIFYLLNLSTIQTFYAPYEAFIAHFAALPWLLLSSLLFLFKPGLKNGIFLTLVLILATPQAYLPTLFVVYILSLLLLIAVLKLIDKSSFSWKTLVQMLLLIFVINAFWLLPFLYFTVTSSGVTLSAKINQMSTETIFLQNKAFGDIFDVMLLKGFWFNNVDPNLQSVFVYMLKPWRDYLANPLMQAIGYLFFGVILTGIIAALRKRNSVLLAFSLLFLFSFTMLSTNTPPFSWFDILFRKIPLFDEAFRFSFTKFSVLASLTYSIFFALGITKLSSLPIIKRLKFYPLVAVFAILIFVFTLPVFTGNLFYNKERLKLPNEYYQVFSFFNSQDPNTRIADLPQPTFWGWEFYNWGYGGSGFLWYGIPQPILDRAFDVWSSFDENYYWELSQAIYSKNPVLFESVLNKYQINWLLFDKNLIYPSSPTSLFSTQTQDLIRQIPSISKTATFGNIEIYKVALRDKPKNFIFFANNLNLVNPYKWDNLDRPYLDLGNYSSSENNQGYFYPFRSLLSNKNQNDNEYTMKDKGSEIILQNPIPEYKTAVTLDIPSFMQNEQIIPANFTAVKNNDGSDTLSVNVQTPEISVVGKDGLNKTVLYSKTLNLMLATIPKGFKNTLNININGITNYKFNPETANNALGTTFFLLHQNNIIVVNGPSFASKTITLTYAALNAWLTSGSQSISLPGTDKDSVLQVEIPEISDGYESFNQKITKDVIKTVSNCDNFNDNPVSSSIVNLNGNTMLRMQSQQSTGCIYFYAPNLLTDQSYAIFIKNANLTGRGLHFWLLNEDEKYSPIDTYFDGGNNLKVATYIIPPQESFGRAYSLHFDNISLLNEPTVNELGNISLYPIPFNFITSLKLSNGTVNTTFSAVNGIILHPNPSEYIVKNVQLAGAASVILSQAYDAGWNAYEVEPSNSNFLNWFNRNFPSVFATRVKNHVLINNWENGWIIDGSIKHNFDLIIIYTPQYLEWFGFSLIPIALLLTIVFLRLKVKKQSPVV